MTSRPDKLAADTFRVISRIFLMTFSPNQWLTCAKYRHLECTIKVNDKYIVPKMAYPQYWDIV